MILSVFRRLRKARDAASTFLEALSSHQQGRLSEAEGLYREVIHLAPDHVQSLYNLGLIHLRRGEPQDAAKLLHQALRQKPKFAEAHTAAGMALQALGRLGEAIAHYEKAIAFRPNYAEAEQNFGAALQALGRAEEAIAHYEKALALKPNSAEAERNFGAVLQVLGRHRKAIIHYENALVLRPDYAEAEHDFATALQALGRPAEALAHYEKAVALRPDYAEAEHDFGTALQVLRRHPEAVEHYLKAAALRPDYTATQLNLGSLLHSLGRPEEAARAFEMAQARAPDQADLYLRLGGCYVDAGCPDNAVQSLQHAVQINPRNARARWLLTMAHLPVIYRDTTEIDRRRLVFHQALEELARDCRTDDPEETAEAANAVGLARPFYLAYQGRSDYEQQHLYGDLLARVMSARYPALAKAPVPRFRPSGAPVKVGIVSGFFRDHSNWKVPIRGWTENLTRERFELYGYHTTDVVDRVTATATANFVKFVQGPLSIEAWGAAIRGDRLDLLIFPDTGMDPDSIRLAALKLAPVQATSWGHPVTSGLPTIRYFISSDLMEPADASSHYTEELIRLPGLGIWYEPTEKPIVADQRETLGLAPEDVLYWSCQSLYKYLPATDWIFPEIAAAVPRARFLFIRHPTVTVTEIFRGRLVRAFAAKGLSAERHCLFLERLDFARFIAVAAASDVFLDNPGWSGCNSTLEALTTHLPIVTRRGELMRTRHSSAMLTVMGMNDLIGNTDEAFVRIAIMLGKDAALRQFTREQIAATCHRLYYDKTAILGLEDFIERAVAVE